ncbi:hypothetical protein AWW66_02460 [Micromonospora rosaria]|uniref:Uncharacterized protein n=1 Tax=Micromonospora rosaria TaxID=47874 RepID=A0A136PYT4_9ACTN|nr:hypothetical protein [Micromonospora rosaria]KXK63629.1 hypothetical protein AWW66_02460 [Micromonospora rosaria]
MAFRTWGRLLPTALGVSALAGAGQLGIGYAFGILRFTGDYTGAAADRWPAQLVWAGWFAAVAATTGAVVADRLAHRDRLPVGPAVQLAVAGAAGLGATVVAPLCMRPARAADLGAVDPVWAVALCALLGAVVGAGAALAVPLYPPLGWNVALLAGTGWLLALLSVTPSILGTGPLPTVRLGVLEPAWLDPDVAQRLAVLLLPLVALIAGAVTGALARRHGHPPVVTGVSGVAGPALFAFTYLAAGPGTGVDRYQAAPYAGALIAVATGALGATAATVWRWPVPGWPTGAGWPSVARTVTGRGTATAPPATPARTVRAVEPSDILLPLPSGTGLPGEGGVGTTDRSADGAPSPAGTAGTGPVGGESVGGEPVDAVPVTGGEVGGGLVGGAQVDRAGTGEDATGGVPLADGSSGPPVPPPAHWEWPVTSTDTPTPRPTPGTRPAPVAPAPAPYPATTAPPTEDGTTPATTAPAMTAPATTAPPAMSPDSTTPSATAPPSLTASPSLTTPGSATVPGGTTPDEPRPDSVTHGGATYSGATSEVPGSGGATYSGAGSEVPGSGGATVGGTAAEAGAVRFDVPERGTVGDGGPYGAGIGAAIPEPAPPRHDRLPLPDLANVPSWNAFAPPRRTDPEPAWDEDDQPEPAATTEAATGADAPGEPDRTPTAEAGAGRFTLRRGLFRRNRNRPEQDDPAATDRGRERSEPVPEHDEEYVDWVTGLGRPGPEQEVGPRSLRSPGRHHRD